jgi:sugar-specific transcriptional regulator TrmB
MRNLGLTSNQARVYLAAAQWGIESVSKISNASGVRREDTYRTLPELEKLGLIQRIPGKPMKVRAEPIEQGFSILIKNWRDEVSKKELELNDGRDELVRYFKAYKKSTTQDEKEKHFALLLEQDKVLDKLKTVLRNAEKEIDLVSSQKELLKVIPLTARALGKETTRQLKARIIIDGTMDEKSLREAFEDHLPKLILDLRHMEKSHSHYLIIDYHQVMMATSPEPSLGRLPYIWTDAVGFAEILQRNFEDLWQTCMSKPVEITT